MKRLRFLDSIRGLAALIVVTTHLWTVTQSFWFVDVAGLKIFRAGGFAVDIFFVLSGLVLFLQIENERPNYLVFVVRRIFRLFPPCIVAILASYAIYSFWDPAPVADLLPAFNEISWPPGITFEQFLWHLPLVGDTALLRPIWSLVIEWRVSLVFPIIAAAFLVAPRVTLAAAVALALLIANAAPGPGWVLITAFYATFFVAGIAIAYFREEVTAFLDIRYVRPSLIALIVYVTCLRALQGGLIGIFYAGIAASLTVAICVSSPRIQQFLEIAPLLFLGRISYSLYLWHMICIGVIFRLLPNTQLAAAILSLGASTAVAFVSQKFIEVPSIKAGKWLIGQLISPRSKATGVAS